MRECIGCGCTDTEACVDEQTGATCHWVILGPVEFDGGTVPEGMGVCSFCVAGFSPVFRRASTQENGGLPLVRLATESGCDRLLRHRGNLPKVAMR